MEPDFLVLRAAMKSLDVAVSLRGEDMPPVDDFSESGISLCKYSGMSYCHAERIAMG